MSERKSKISSVDIIGIIFTFIVGLSMAFMLTRYVSHPLVERYLVNVSAPIYEVTSEVLWSYRLFDIMLQVLLILAAISGAVTLFKTRRRM